MIEEIFTPIKIVDFKSFGKLREQKKEVCKYSFTFNLSAEPSVKWSDIFDDVWNSSNDRKKAQVSAGGIHRMCSNINVTCPLENLKEVFTNLKQTISSVNDKYREQTLREAEERDRAEKEKEAEILRARKLLKEVLASLDYS